eukprot:879236-Pyramimonas_sp.AAC.1
MPPRWTPRFQHCGCLGTILPGARAQPQPPQLGGGIRPCRRALFCPAQRRHQSRRARPPPQPHG